MAVPGKVSVYRGNTVIIPLRASGRTPGQIRFIVRTEPKFGTLGEILVTGPTTAEVAYTHNDGPPGSINLHSPPRPPTPRFPLPRR